MLSLIKQLMSDLKKQTQKGPYTPDALQEAVLNNDSAFVKAYIHHFQNNPKQLDHPNGTYTPLLFAFDREHHDIARLLIEAGADVNIGNFMHSTPLHRAAGEGHLEMVKCLIKHGAVIDSMDSNRHTPLSLASETGQLDVIEYLVDHGATVNDSIGANPIWIAASWGRTEAVALLLKKGADIKGANHEGYTPLLKAVQKGHKDMVRLLLDKGAKPEESYEGIGGFCRPPKTTAKGISQKKPLLEVAKSNAYWDPNKQEIVEMIRKKTTPCFQYRLDAINYHGPIPLKWVDVLSKDKNKLMNDPITVSSGITYDREALYTLFTQKDHPEGLECPITKKIIYQEELESATNEIIKNDMEEFVSNCENEARLRLEEDCISCTDSSDDVSYSSPTFFNKRKSIAKDTLASSSLSLVQ